LSLLWRALYALIEFFISIPISSLGRTREDVIIRHSAVTMLKASEWYRVSQRFLNPAKTRVDYLAAFLAKPAKVRIPTGDGDTINKTLQAVAKLAGSELPVISSGEFAARAVCKKAGRR
jgi:hypothetical protein